MQGGAMFTLLFFFCLPLQNNAQNTGDIRLAGGTYQWEGRVEIYLSGTWGTVTDSHWSNDDAQVVCRKLGHFKPGAVPQSGAYFGEGSGPIHLDEVTCIGTEYNLTMCQTSNNSRQTSHSEDVGVQCQPAEGSYQEGDIRLIGGSYDWEGRVEIFLSEIWGTINDDSWNVDDAEVVCRQLGHSTSGAVALCCASFGLGSGPIHLGTVACLGSEPNITSCSYSASVSGNHQDDVEVQCQPRTTAERPGRIRQVGGSYNWEGRVEIFLSGIWGTIGREYGYSSSSYDTAAKVVCQQLGYGDDGTSSYFDKGSGPIVMNIPYCNGNERRLTMCTENTGSSNYNDWGAKCSPDNPQSGDIRLYNKVRVEIFLSGAWGTVTNNIWTTQNSKVACQQLGYFPNGTLGGRYDNYDRNPPPIHIESVFCTGSESRLIDCSHGTNTTEQDHSDDVLLQCQNASCNIGDTRLVGGQTEREGRVEICWKEETRGAGGRWGTVCDNQWSPAHTEVLCSSLGFAPDGIFFTSDTFGQGTGLILMDYVNCSGSEFSLWDCSHFTHSYGCTHSDDVGIRCQPVLCEDGQVRLVSNTLQYTYAADLDDVGRLEEDGYVRVVIPHEEWRGRLDVCFNQRWGTVHIIDDYVETRRTMAEVVCRQLGFSPTYSSVLYSEDVVPGVGPIYLTDVDCTGREYRLLDCQYSTDTGNLLHFDDYYSGDAGILCEPVPCQDGEVRLVEGETEWEGRLEVCLSQRWGTVSSDGWTLADSRVVCSDLGYEMNSNTDVLYSTRPATKSQPIFMDNVVCLGTQLSLLDCSYDSDTSDDDHSKDVMLQCQQPSCSDGDIRLVNGVTQYDGQVKVCFNQKWGTVNGNGWSNIDTQVVCRQLGYQTADVSFYWVGHSRKVSAPIHMNNVGCYGHEDKLTDCSFGTHTIADKHLDDIGVYCNADAGDIPSTTSSNTDTPSSPPSFTDIPSTALSFFNTQNIASSSTDIPSIASSHTYPQSTTSSHIDSPVSPSTTKTGSPNSSAATTSSSQNPAPPPASSASSHTDTTVASSSHTDAAGTSSTHTGTTTTSSESDGTSTMSSHSASRSTTSSDTGTTDSSSTSSSSTSTSSSSVASPTTDSETATSKNSNPQNVALLFVAVASMVVAALSLAAVGAFIIYHRITLRRTSKRNDEVPLLQQDSGSNIGSLSGVNGDEGKSHAHDPTTVETGESAIL